jgi:hypothetical protein
VVLTHLDNLVPLVFLWDWASRIATPQARLVFRLTQVLWASRREGSHLPPLTEPGVNLDLPGSHRPASRFWTNAPVSEQLRRTPRRLRQTFTRSLLASA